MAEKEQRYYTILEVAKLLKVSDDTIRRMIASGELEAFKVSHHWRISQEAIDKLQRKKQ